MRVKSNKIVINSSRRLDSSKLVVHNKATPLVIIFYLWLLFLGLLFFILHLWFKGLFFNREKTLKTIKKIKKKLRKVQK